MLVFSTIWKVTRDVEFAEVISSNGVGERGGGGDKNKYSNFAIFITFCS